MAVVEYLWQQNGIQTWVTAQDVFPLDWGFNAVLFACLKNELRSLLLALVPVSLVKVIAHTLKYMAVPVAIDQILSQVSYFSITSILGDMVVNPPDQDLLIA